jgi:hypothetical protein
MKNPKDWTYSLSGRALAGFNPRVMALIWEHKLKWKKRANILEPNFINQQGE